MKSASVSSTIFVTALTLAVAACGTSNQGRATDAATAPSAVTTIAQPSTTAPTVERPVRVADKTVRIDRGRLHIHCNGQGASTVLLIAGWDNSGDEGWSPVQPKIGTQARVCSYDRFGTGTSDEATTRQTFTTQATDLHELLAKADEPGPYVVVGHSFGGAEAVEFASHYRDEVVGLMLIDASPTTWPAALCAVPADGGPAAGDYATTCGVFHHPQLDAERLDAFASFNDIARIDSLGSLPMTVMTASERTLPGLNDREIARLTQIWNDGVARWAALSTASKVVSVENTGHDIQREHPDVVTSQVAKLIP